MWVVDLTTGKDGPLDQPPAALLPSVQRLLRDAMGGLSALLAAPGYFVHAEERGSHHMHLAVETGGSSLVTLDLISEGSAREVWGTLTAATELLSAEVRGGVLLCPQPPCVLIRHEAPLLSTPLGLRVPRLRAGDLVAPTPLTAGSAPRRLRVDPRVVIPYATGLAGLFAASFDQLAEARAFGRPHPPRAPVAPPGLPHPLVQQCIMAPAHWKIPPGEGRHTPGELIPHVVVWADADPDDPAVTFVHALPLSTQRFNLPGEEETAVALSAEELREAGISQDGLKISTLQVTRLVYSKDLPQGRGRLSDAVMGTLLRQFLAHSPLIGLGPGAAGLVRADGHPETNPRGCQRAAENILAHEQRMRVARFLGEHRAEIPQMPHFLRNR